MTAVGWSRLQFGFTITYHYLFPQLTMGLALIILIFRALAYRTGNERYLDLARFWARIFGINFAIGVVTGIPLEFQFGTNWGRFSERSGGVIGLTLAMEGMFAFFAESAFLGLFLFGEKKLSRRNHFLSGVMVFLGSWASGYFIIATNAFMQHPVGYRLDEQGRFVLSDVGAYLFNKWVFWEYAHTMSAAVITGAFVVAGVSAYWALMKHHEEHARTALRVSVITGLVACVLQLFPTGDQSGKLVAEHQPAALAAMEAKFETSTHAELAIIGQPNIEERRLENPIEFPVLSFLSYGSFGAEVKGLEAFPKDQWPDNIELLYYAYHVMVGIGTLLFAVMGFAGLLLFWGDRLSKHRIMLWVLMLSVPFPYIATTAGWMTAELGRQPWVIYGLLRTADGTSPRVSGGSVAFSTLGYLGLYGLLSILFVFLMGREIGRGPKPA